MSISLKQGQHPKLNFSVNLKFDNSVFLVRYWLIQSYTSRRHDSLLTSQDSHNISTFIAHSFQLYPALGPLSQHSSSHQAGSRSGRCANSLHCCIRTESSGILSNDCMPETTSIILTQGIIKCLLSLFCTWPFVSFIVHRLRLSQVTRPCGWYEFCVRHTSNETVWLLCGSYLLILSKLRTHTPTHTHTHTQTWGSYLTENKTWVYYRHRVVYVV